MMASEYDANQGLQEGRRINPGPVKLPKPTYMKLWDFVVIGLAAVAALALISKHGDKLFEFFRRGGDLWKFLSAGIGGG